MATYYVDPVDGNDTNTGQSPTDAWKTLRYAIENVPSSATHTIKVVGNSPVCLEDNTGRIYVRGNRNITIEPDTADSWEFQIDTNGWTDLIVFYICESANLRLKNCIMDGSPLENLSLYEIFDFGTAGELELTDCQFTNIPTRIVSSEGSLAATVIATGCQFTSLGSVYSLFYINGFTKLELRNCILEAPSICRVYDGTTEVRIQGCTLTLSNTLFDPWNVTDPTTNKLEFYAESCGITVPTLCKENQGGRSFKMIACNVTLTANLNAAIFGLAAGSTYERRWDSIHLEKTTISWTTRIASSYPVLRFGIGCNHVVVKDCRLLHYSGSTGGFEIAANNCQIVRNRIRMHSGTKIQGAQNIVLEGNLIEGCSSTVPALHVTSDGASTPAYTGGLRLLDNVIRNWFTGPVLTVDAGVLSTNRCWVDRNVYYTKGTTLANIGGMSCSTVADMQATWTTNGWYGNDQQSVVRDTIHLDANDLDI